MNVKGNHDFNIPRAQLWSYLMDPEVLAKITPGVTRLEIIEADHYNSVSDIKIGPVKGSFSGNLKVVNKNEPGSFDIEMEQLSKIGNAHVTVHMDIEDKGDQLCALAFDGKAKLSGVIARTGQRVLSGVANTLTNEVFAALEKHIEENAESTKEKPSSSIAATAPKPNIQTGEETTKGAVEKISTTNTTTSVIEPTNNNADINNQSKGLLASIIQFFKNLFGGSNS